MRRVAGVVALVGVVASTLAVATTHRSGNGESTGERTAAAWVPLPPLPTSGVVDVDGAAITSANGRLYAAVLDRQSDRQPSAIQSFRLESRNRWVRLERLIVNRDEPFFLTGGRQAGIVVAVARSIRARCQSSHGRIWRAAGPAAFMTTFPAPTVSLAGAFSSNGRLYVIRAEKRFAHAGRSQRLTHRVLRLDGQTWRQIGASDIDPTAALGSERVTAVTRGDRPCLLYDALSADPAEGPSVRERCLERNEWRATSTPPLTLQRVSPPLRRGREAINVDGVAAIGSKKLFVGVDHFRPTGTDWPVYQAGSSGWRDVEPAAQPAGWNAQGSLYALNGRLWAIRFDQRPGPAGLRTRLVVLRQRGRGRLEQVGHPLLDDEPLRGPLYWGLATVKARFYALATVPDGTHRRNVARILALNR